MEESGGFTGGQPGVSYTRQQWTTVTRLGEEHPDDHL